MRKGQVNGRRQQRRSREEVEQFVNAFERSGLRRREFCLQHGVALGTLDRWLRRRRQERGRMARNREAMRHEDARVRTTTGSRLVAVEVAGWPAAGREGQAASGGLAVVVSCGRRIEVSRGFDVATLERLLDVLEQG
jgi:transposase-like protein